MTISVTRYVDIRSTVGAGTTVSRRQLVGRMFDSNELIPSDSFLTFNSASEVRTYFGVDSEEYARALFYFSWVSKNRTTIDSLQFASYTPIAVEPRIFGNIQTQTPAAYNLITAGSFSITIGGVTNDFTAIDLSASAGLAGVATDLQTVIQAAASGGVMWTAATVTYDAVRGSFDFVGGDIAAEEITTALGTSGQTELGTLLGWITGETLVLSAGSLGQTALEAVQSSTDLSDNFGSFLFVDDLTDDDMVSVAEWNDLPEQNVKFMYMVRAADETDATTLFTALSPYSGTGITLAPLADEYPEQVPMMILAATNYNNVNSSQNYMFQQFALTSSVSTDADADIYDAMRINYYGVTQTAGQFIAFYQRGKLMGIATDPLAMNVYANEIWFKDAMTSTILQLLLTVNRLPANKTGQSQLLTALQTVIQEALNNGVISAGKTLSDAQIAYITSVAGDVNAWYQVQNAGYWVTAIVETFEPTPGDIEYRAVYTLIYGKDDVINKIEGEQILI